MYQTILVTGGAGFIGSALCRELNARGASVISLDNYHSGSVENHVPGVKYIEGSTKDIDSLITAKIDLLIHLGEYSRVEQSFEEIEKVLELNTVGTLRVLEFVRKRRIKLVYAGSSTKFSDSVLGPNQSPYAWSKSSNTQLVKNYGVWYNIEYAITYFYNVYGSGEINEGKYATLIGIFTDKYLHNEPLPVVLPGTQKRNFTHIDDIVEGIIQVSISGNGDDYGIGSNDAFSILEVANMFGSSIEYLPERLGNRMNASLITENTRKLGWKPKHKLKDYIKSIISK
ncbi:NAD-dependent epimerase/dehydratase family protein [bacterium]|nr:NAD-dependent epimerase/dehydratase family protein [bacterium]